VSIAVHLPDELAARLAAESARRGISVEELTAELLGERLPSTGPDNFALDAFIGSGSSGHREPFDIHRARAELAEHLKPAESA
jgi:plasmid stability protein